MGAAVCVANAASRSVAVLVVVEEEEEDEAFFRGMGSVAAFQELAFRQGMQLR